ncbi:RTA1 like protein-domain-containing protein [Fusarium flagelliforme]|uniref:RTA1 like protein-domain-containing protein n=1 Tax=Fusarium flagelliforme TaxID=2675880 RepID=UPI001E8EE601|nr:RTA1 like protein-domain-containing protein [Fusarium flagelliforme]KAH7186099.1 RTA1 like protein-domain-containing protein [Fusarium flagelliforme]
MAELKTYNGYALWLYLPNVPAAVVFAILFALGTTAITCKCLEPRHVETAGFIARATARDKTDELIPHVIQSVFILVAPALFAASVYMTLGRIIRSIQAQPLSIIRVRLLTKLFVMGDVLSFALQSGGASMMATSDDPKMGENMIIAGLLVQIVVFGIYVVTSVIFHYRVRTQRPNVYANFGNNWEKLLVMLYIISALIMVRSVFRVVEYVGGQDGYLLKHEWTLYVFDALLMFATVVIFAWRFPGPVWLKSMDIEFALEGQRPSESPPRKRLLQCRR